MEFLIISGMSGAGKSMAADILEDMDYYCVDNMPVALLPRFAELCIATRGRYERVALVTDVRERESIPGLIDALDKLWEQGLEYRILFVEADTPTIVRRYKSSRRPHPMLAGGSIEDAVRRELALLSPLRERADYIINTTGLTTAMLQARIADILPSGGAGRRLAVTVTAFGYKYGLLFAEPVLCRGTAAALGAGRAGLGLRALLRGREALFGDAGLNAEVPHAALSGGGQVQPQHSHRLHGRPAQERGGDERAGGQALGAGLPDGAELQGSREGMNR